MAARSAVVLGRVDFNRHLERDDPRKAYLLYLDPCAKHAARSMLRYRTYFASIMT